MLALRLVTHFPNAIRPSLFAQALFPTLTHDRVNDFYQPGWDTQTLQLYQ